MPSNRPGVPPVSPGARGRMTMRRETIEKHVAAALDDLDDGGRCAIGPKPRNANRRVWVEAKYREPEKDPRSADLRCLDCGLEATFTTEDWEDWSDPRETTDWFRSQPARVRIDGHGRC